MLEKALSILALCILSGCIGWYYRGHLDVFERHTGFIGSYISGRLEGRERCPKGFVCTQITPASREQ